jgi:hypothetical protein
MRILIIVCILLISSARSKIEVDCQAKTAKIQSGFLERVQDLGPHAVLILSQCPKEVK